MSDSSNEAAPSLEAVRARIDALDGELLRLLDERAALARVVAEAKRARGEADRFALRPARETAILRRLIASERRAASPSLIVRVWREMIGDSLSVQGPFHVAVWGGRDPGRMVELARQRVGAAPPLVQVPKPEDAIARARRGRPRRARVRLRPPRGPAPRARRPGAAVRRRARRAGPARPQARA
ncbi:MAG: chorismate mutase, partial [Phenylobacterium sp.]